jgi:hypothetical protein
MRQAANIGGGDDFRLLRLQVAELAFAQLVGNGRLQDRVGTRRAAAQVGFGRDATSVSDTI